MPQPVDTMRSALQALEHDREAFIEHLSPHFEGVVLPSVSAEPDSYKGHDGVRRYFDLFDDVVDDLRFASGEMEEAGNWVIADVFIRGRGHSSGAPMEMSVAMAVQVEDGQIARIVAYPDRATARSAVA